MSSKSTLINQNSNITFAPELEKLLSQYGCIKQKEININNDTNNDVNNNIIESSIQSSNDTPTPFLKVKKPILDTKYLNSPKDRYQHTPVQPIPTDYIQKAKEYFHQPSRYSANNLRNLAYFCISINTARRAGDILKLQVKDILNEDGTFKKHIILHEQKTGKRAVVLLNDSAKEALSEYLNTKNNYCMSDILFTNYKTGEALTVDGVRKMIKRMTKAIGLTEGNYGSHSLRKTFITELIKNNPNNSEIEIMASQILNHSSVQTTYRYMGLTQKKLDKLVEDNQL